MSTPVSQTTRFGFLRRVLTPPAFEDDAYKTRTARLLHVILLSLAGVILLFATLEILVGGIGIVLVFTEVMGLIYFGLWIVMRRGHVRLVGIVTVSLFLLSTTTLIYFTGTIHTSITAFYIVGVVLAGLLLGNRGMLIFAGLSLLALGGLLQLEMMGRLPPATLESANIGQWLTYAGILAVIAVLLGLFTTSLNQALARAQANEESLAQRNRELQVIRESLEERVAQRTAQLEASAEVGRAAASNLDTQQLMREVVNLITNRFGFYYAAIFLADSANQWAVLREGTGEAGRILKERNHRLEIGGQSMVGTVMKTRQSRIALDVGAEAVRFANPLLPATRSEITLPLVVGDHVLGALDVQSTQAEAFDEPSAAVLQTMADQIAIALNNANQFRQAESALRRTNLLYAIAQTLAEATTAEDILSDIVNYIGAEANWSGLFIYGPRRDTDELEYVELAATWIHPEYAQATQPLQAGTRFTPEQMPLVNVITPGHPLIVSDIQSDDVPISLRGLMQRFGANALIGLPLVAGETLLGILALGYYTARHFDADQLQLLTTLARQIAIVLQNQQSLQTSQAALAQLNQANQRLVGEAWQEYTKTIGGGVRKVKMGYGLSPDATQAPLPTSLAAPVVVSGIEIGALRLEDAAPDREWTPTEVSLLQSVASEVSIALERARLIEQTQRDAERERTINQITAKMRNAQNVDQVLRIAVQELRAATKASLSAVEIAPGSEASPGNGHKPGE